MSKVLAIIAAIIGAVIQWYKGSKESDTRTQNRVRQLEDAAVKDRQERLRRFDEKAAAVSGADDAVELLRDVQADDPTLN